MHFFKEPNPTALLFYVKNRRSVRRQRSEPATAMNSTRLIKSRMTTHGVSKNPYLLPPFREPHAMFIMRPQYFAPRAYLRVISHLYEATLTPTDLRAL